MSTALVVCTHNPNIAVFRRVLASCVEQQPPANEILIVDSGSSEPITFEGTQHGVVCIVRENPPGLARARVRAIRETTSETICFVDDDTVLAENYVRTACHILDERPYLGAIGGQLLPEYEGTLPLPERYYRQRLAIREFRGNHWSNRWDDFATSPIGGGMVVRRQVAEEWARRFSTTAWRSTLGRSGASMNGGEDFDLLHTACEMGYGKGIFEKLQLTHVIPNQRLHPEFLVRITEGNNRSWAFLRGMLDPAATIPRRTILHRLNVVLQAARKTRLDRQLFLAAERGTWQGWNLVRHQRIAAGS